jgi:hypothetical protein
MNLHVVTLIEHQNPDMRFNAMLSRETQDKARVLKDIGFRI